jgi:hypothetical protein
MQSSNRKKAPLQSSNARRNKKDWIGEQFKRVYDATAQEPLPEDMQKMLDALEELESPEDKGSGTKDDE